MKIDSPNVSVIVLTFNSEKYIARCLDALCSQTLHDFEVVVVDAGSTDLSEKIVNSYSKVLSVRFIVAIGTDMGQARNVGMHAARGKYITFCDSDDLYLPWRLEAGVDALNQNQLANVSYGLAGHFKGDPASEKYLSRRISFASGDLAKEITKEQMLNISTLTIRKEVTDIVHFREDGGGRYGEDWQYLISLCAAKASFTGVPKVLTLVDVRPDSHTTWDIQHWMKWYVFQHLLLNQAELGVKNTAPVYWNYHLCKHWLKLQLAAIVSGNPRFPKAAYAEAFDNVPMAIAALDKILSILSSLPGLSNMIQKIWLLNRQRKQKNLPKTLRELS